MSYPAGTFSAIIDKSLLDFLIYTQRNERDTAAMLSECARVAQEDTPCIFLSWCPPREMKVHMAGCPWDVETIQLEAPCDESGRVPIDASITVVHQAKGFSSNDQKSCSKHRGSGEPALLTDFFLYVCMKRGGVGLEEGALSGEEKAEVGDFVGAIQTFCLEIESRPCEETLYESVAQCYLMSEKVEEVTLSVTFATKATLLSPDWGVGHLTLARCHLAVCNFSLAVESFERAVACDPSLEPEVAEDLLIAKQEDARRYCGACD